MQIYLPIAEMAVRAEMIFFVSAFVGTLAGLFGIGGGFLVTPFLIFIGVPPAVAVGTQPCQIAASAMAGMMGHLRKGYVDFKMGGVMVAGSTLGSLLGIGIFKILQYLGQVDFAISLLYVILLGAIGLLMLIESFTTTFIKRKTMRSEFNSFKMSTFMARLPFKMRFPRSKLYISALVPAAIGFFCGILGTILGVGGGFMLVPAMIYLIGMPGLMVAGTSLFQIILMTSLATIMHAVANQTVDILLGAILIVGGVIGAQVGVFFTKYVHGAPARIVLAILILVVCMELSGQLVVEPKELFSTVVR